MGAPQNVIGRLTSQEGMNYSYPADIHNTPYACVLRFSKYQREISYNEGTQNPTGSIILPLPSNLTESTTITHSDFESPYIAGALQAMQSVKQGESPIDAALRIGQDNIGLGANKAVEAIGKHLNTLTTSGSMASNLTAEIANAGRSGAITGLITNPHLTVLFSGVALRGYVYNWSFSPRSQADSDTLNAIFNMIRRASLPSYTEGKLGLVFPDEVQIDFIGNGIEKYVLGTKRTVITDVTINYANEGHPTFYKGGAPTSLSLSITLKEVAIRTAEDYGSMTASSTNFGRG